MGTITSANAILMLSQATIFPVPQQLQGFAADDIYDIDQVASVETQMGVDGVLSGGFVWTAITQNIVLQADSRSNDFFDALWMQMQATQDVYPLNGILSLPSIQSKFTQTRGFLTGYTPAPAGKRVLQPRRYTITWERVAPALI